MSFNAKTYDFKQTPSLDRDRKEALLETPLRIPSVEKLGDRESATHFITEKADALPDADEYGNIGLEPNILPNDVSPDTILAAVAGTLKTVLLYFTEEHRSGGQQLKLAAGSFVEAIHEVYHQHEGPVSSAVGMRSRGKIDTEPLARRLKDMPDDAKACDEQYNSVQPSTEQISTEQPMSNDCRCAEA